MFEKIIQTFDIYQAIMRHREKEHATTNEENKCQKIPKTDRLCHTLSITQ